MEVVAFAMRTTGFPGGLVPLSIHRPIYLADYVGRWRMPCARETGGIFASILRISGSQYCDLQILNIHASEFGGSGHTY